MNKKTSNVLGLQGRKRFDFRGTTLLQQTKLLRLIGAMSGAPGQRLLIILDRLRSCWLLQGDFIAISVYRLSAYGRHSLRQTGATIIPHHGMFFQLLNWHMILAAV